MTEHLPGNEPAHRFRFNRRNFLPGLAQEVWTLAGRLRGGRAFSLDDLSLLPDEQLARIVPGIRPGVDLMSDGEHICARELGVDTRTSIRPAVPADVLVCAQIDGRTSVGQLVERLVLASGLARDQARQSVRSLVLDLIRLGVCVPINGAVVDDQGVDQTGPHEVA